MGGPTDVSPLARQGRWTLEGGVLFAPSESSSGEAEAPNVGPIVEFTRRIPFGAGTLQVGQLPMDNHWSLDLGVGGQAAGWDNGRPSLLSLTGRAGINYNLLNRIGVGMAFRGGYANVAGRDEGSESTNGLIWSGGLRFSGTITSISFFAENGFLSLPGNDGRETGFYGLAGAGYLF